MAETTNATAEAQHLTDGDLVKELSLRRATVDDRPKVAAILAAGFLDDPILTWAFPDRGRRRDLLPGVFATFFDSFQGLDETYLTGGTTAAAVCAPPGGEPDEAKLAELAKAASEYAARTAELNEAIASGHPESPHYYLLFLATQPRLRSRGIGSAILGQILERCDRDGVPMYLDATAERNRDLYLRHGFEVTEEVRLPGGTPFWRMWREPR